MLEALVRTLDKAGTCSFPRLLVVGHFQFVLFGVLGRVCLQRYRFLALGDYSRWVQMLLGLVHRYREGLGYLAVLGLSKLELLEGLCPLSR